MAFDSLLSYEERWKSFCFFVFLEITVELKVLVFCYLKKTSVGQTPWCDVVGVLWLYRLYFLTLHRRILQKIGVHCLIDLRLPNVNKTSEFLYKTSGRRWFATRRWVTSLVISSVKIVIWDGKSHNSVSGRSTTLTEWQLVRWYVLLLL